MAEEHPIRAHEETFKDLKASVKEIEEKLFKGGEKIARLESSASSAHKRLDSREDELKVLTRLVVGVEHLGEEMAKLVQTVKNHDDEIEALKLAPGKKALDFWQAVGMTIVTGIAAMFLTLVFTGQIGG
jgi:chromosome segregation ATPase